jgi:hypothetical protein
MVDGLEQTPSNLAATKTRIRGQAAEDIPPVVASAQPNVLRKMVWTQPASDEVIS